MKQKIIFLLMLLLNCASAANAQGIIRHYYKYSTSHKFWTSAYSVLNSEYSDQTSYAGNVTELGVMMYLDNNGWVTPSITKYDYSVGGGTPYNSVKTSILSFGVGSSAAINPTSARYLCNMSNGAGIYCCYVAEPVSAMSSSTNWLGFGITHPSKSPDDVYAFSVYVKTTELSQPQECNIYSTPDPDYVDAIKMLDGNGEIHNGSCMFDMSAMRTDDVVGNTDYEIVSATAIDGTPLTEGADYEISSTTLVTTKKPGTFVIKANFKGNSSTGYFPATSTANYTVGIGDIPMFHKTMSCVINEIDLTHSDFNYPGYQNFDENWAANSRNLRYVKTNRTYDKLPQSYLNNQIVLNTTDASTVSSGKIVIGAADKIVSNPVMSDEAQFDYVIPNNGAVALADGKTVTFTRGGFPGKNAKGQYTYGTICLPFNVTSSDMPSGFKFERYDNNIMKDGSRYSVFQEVSSVEAGVPYLVYNTGSTSANLAITSDAASAWATNPTADSYFMGTFNDLIFDDINSNTAANPYNNTGAAADAHKGELNDFFAALYNYNSDGYLMANPGGDKIKKSSKTVRNKTMLRPFRAYFLLEKGAPASAMAMAVMHISLDDELPTTISYLDAEGKEVEIVDVYTVGGVRIAKDKLETEALNDLPAGLYILSNGKKVSKK